MVLSYCLCDLWCASLEVGGVWEKGCGGPTGQKMYVGGAVPQVIPIHNPNPNPIAHLPLFLVTFLP